jgi:o-succinylbenzoate synthase
MLKADFQKYTLKFKVTAGTSRGAYTLRDSWFISLHDSDLPHLRGIGECAPLPGLSPELDRGFEAKLKDVCRDIDHYDEWIADGLKDYASIKMGLETAMGDYRAAGSKIFFHSQFSEGEQGIPINGLIWMGSVAFMKKQIREKITEGYRCLKIKIGALDFEAELNLIRQIREIFTPEDIEIRLDANGAFQPDEAISKLDTLAKLGIHSIEQPIMAGQFKALRMLCAASPIPIALDEELIGIEDLPEKELIVRDIRPAYLVLKPSLHGGFRGCREWIDIAEASGIGWWVTSALESNIGLNAIAQWTSTLNNPLPQGLGTGQLFTNNFTSPLYIRSAQLWRDRTRRFDLSGLNHD